MGGRGLNGKVAVITGAAGGMGRVACRTFCEQGAKVIGSDLDGEAGATLEKELRGEGHDFTFEPGDVTTPQTARNIAAVVRDTHGRLDILYNNAGVVLGRHVLETTDQEWDLVQDVIVKGIFLMTRELVPLMDGEGAIVNIASTAGIVGVPGMAAYCAAKGAIIGFTKCCAVDLAPGIRVNAVCPGVIDTRMPRDLVSTLPEDQAEAVWREFEEGHLIGRLGRPEEIVDVAAFLAGDLASNITGAEIVVDGGYTAK